ncbi:MAG: LemA family protein [Candidatus Woesearchaeota archaeon]
MDLKGAFFGLILTLVLAFIIIYNLLVTKKNRVKNALAQIDVQLKRRADLIPKLVAAVKGYKDYEKGVLKEIVEARSAFLKASSFSEVAKADKRLSKSISSFFAVAESYPQLKADKQFLALQEEISSTENRIGYARQFYNDVVMDYNTMLDQFPYNIIARIFNFKPAEFFQADDASKSDVKIDISG